MLAAGLETVTVWMVVIWTDEVLSTAGTSESSGLSGPLMTLIVGLGLAEGVSVTGQTVVLIATTSVVTWPILPGQLVTVGAQLVIV